MQNDLKQAGVLRANRPQGAILPLGFDSLADAVQQAVRRCFQSDYGERLQIAGVSRAAQFRAAPQISNAFAQRQPLHHRLALAPPLSMYSETSGVVNRRLNPQYAALLVVHFDRVLFNPVFHADTFQPSLQITADLTGKTLVGATLQKAHHFFTTKLKHGMTQQKWIKRRQAGSAAKHHIPGILHLPAAPIITSDIQSRAWVNQGVYFLGQSIKPRVEIACRQTIHQLLCSLRIGNMRKAVVSLAVANAGSVHLACQPLAPVDTNLNTKGEPGLQPHMHQAKLPVQVVKVKMQTLTFLRHQLQMFRGRVFPQIERLTWFDTSKYTDQALLKAVPRYYLQSQFLFRIFRRGQINIRSRRFARQLFRVFHQLLRQTYYITAKILHQHVVAVQKDLQPFNMGNRTQGAAEQHSIKSRKSSSYAVAVPLQQTLHDSPPAVRLLVQTDNAKKRVMERSYFGCGLSRAMQPLCPLCLCGAVRSKRNHRGAEN